MGKLEAYEAPWQEIDYRQSESGKGSFDGCMYMFKTPDGIITGKYVVSDIHFVYTAGEENKLPSWFEAVCSFYKGGWPIRETMTIRPTHYRPIPKGWID